MRVLSSTNPTDTSAISGKRYLVIGSLIVFVIVVGAAIALIETGHSDDLWTLLPLLIPWITHLMSRDNIKQIQQGLEKNAFESGQLAAQQTLQALKGQDTSAPAPDATTPENGGQTNGQGV